MKKSWLWTFLFKKSVNEELFYSMKIIIFNGSPKGERGITYELLKCFSKGMLDANAQVEFVTLSKKTIGRCMGCLHCWNTSEGKCVRTDDMTELIKEIESADIMVLATPLYFNNVSIELKNFLERLMPLSCKNISLGEGNIYKHDCRIKMPPIVMFGTCGLPDIQNLDIISWYGKILSKHWETEIVGEVLRTQAYIFELKDENVQILLRNYQRMLINAGKELVETKRLSEKTMQYLKHKLVQAELFVNTANTIIYGMAEQK